MMVDAEKGKKILALKNSRPSLTAHRGSSGQLWCTKENVNQNSTVNVVNVINERKDANGSLKADSATIYNYRFNDLIMWQTDGSQLPNKYPGPS